MHMQFHRKDGKGSALCIALVALVINIFAYFFNFKNIHLFSTQKSILNG